MSSTRIPFEVETSRIIELLAKQIYQSPLALLRENVQNAFDAIRERSRLDNDFVPCISVTIDSERVVITDNGIGMSADELRKNFWTAGSSSKNTAEARAAGVVGTFGIGAMANFGVAQSLRVETESRRTKERTVSIAELSKLSLREDCVEVERLSTLGTPGTTITVVLSEPSSINPAEAVSYVKSFTKLLDVPVYVNNQLVSQNPVENVVSPIAAAVSVKLNNTKIGSRMAASGELNISSNAVIHLALHDIIWGNNKLAGKIVLTSAQPGLHTARSGFGLAVAPVSSVYNFGGIADLLILEPTAGREAITSDGVQLLQQIVEEIDQFVSTQLSNIDECNSSTAFMRWIQLNQRYDLAGLLTIETAKKDEKVRTEITLNEAAQRNSNQKVSMYSGNDSTVIRTYSSDSNLTLLVLSRTQPRRKCQQEFLALQNTIEEIPDAPTIINRRSGAELDAKEWSVSFRLQSVISQDYFVDTSISFGEISHGVTLIVDRSTDNKNTEIIINPNSESVSSLLQLYETHPEAFPSLAKDFVRTVVFPQIADLVPSSTRQGAEAFIETMKRKRETFEYDLDDSDDLASVLEDYEQGTISLEQFIEHTKKAIRPNVQVVDTTSLVRDVVPDVIENERILAETQATSFATKDNTGSFQWPVEAPIIRSEVSSPTKLITIEQTEQELRGYRCFIALTPKAWNEFGAFFTQPHSTSVIWGGQKTLFIFIHHSGEFGMYYDLQTSEFLNAPSGGGSQRTCTIVLKDKIYIPIPNAISESFIPMTGQRKRFEIRADIIRTGSTI